VIRQITNKENLNRAFLQVKRNKGAGGVDQIQVTDLKQVLRQNALKMLQDLVNGSYQVSPILGVEIPKSNDKMRLPGIPTVVDRVIQQAVCQVLQPVFETDFQRHSYAGDVNSKAAIELLCNIPEHIYAIVDTDDWKKLIENIHNERTEKFTRFRFEKNREHLDPKHLQGYLSMLPEGYELKRIDESLVNEASLHEVSPDFTSQFDSAQDYLNRGLGFCIVHRGKVVSGASSFSIFDNGLEIEVATDDDHRNMGLATIVSSALILDCIEKGIYPNWDAVDQKSHDLAKKLGYVLSQPYDTYYINYKTDA